MNDGPATDGTVRRSQQHWLRVRGFLNRRRHELSRAAQDLYPRAWRVAGTPLLARAEWLPARPVPLDQVRLSWQPGWPARGIDGTGPETAAVLPLREGASRFGCYAAALGALAGQRSSRTAPATGCWRPPRRPARRTSGSARAATSR